MREANTGYDSFEEMFDSLQKQDIVEALNTVQFKDKRISVYYKLSRKGENIYRYLITALINVDDALSIISINRLQ